MHRRWLLAALPVALLLGCVDPDAEEAPTAAVEAPDDAPDPDEEADSSPAEAPTAAPEHPAAGEVLIGVRRSVRVTYEVDAPSRLDEVTLTYEPPRFALRAGGRLLIGDGDDLVVCGVRGDAECVRVEDAAPPEVREAMVSEGLGPVLALARAEADPRPSPPAHPTGGQFEEIAGRWARCATLPADGVEGLEEADVEVCVDTRSGVGLRWVIDQPESGTTRLQAVDVGLPLPRDFLPQDEPIDPLEQPDPEEIG